MVVDIDMFGFGMICIIPGEMDNTLTILKLNNLSMRNTKLHNQTP